MNSFITLLRKELLGQWRTKKIMIIAIVFLFVAVSSPITAKLIPQLLKNLPSSGITIQIPEPTYNDAIAQFMKNTGQLAIFFLIFIAAGAIVEEKNKKTLEMLLVKPITRTKFVLTKYASFFLTIKTLFLFSALIFYFYTLSIFGSFSFLRFLIVAILSLIYVLSIVSLSIFAGSFAKSSAAAGGLGFLGFIIFSILGSIQKTADFAPGYIFSHYSNLIQSGWNSHFLTPALIEITVIILSIIATIIVFRNQEVER